MAYFIIMILLLIGLSISSLVGIVDFFRKGKERGLIPLILLILLFQFSSYAGRFEYLSRSTPVIVALLLFLLILIFLILTENFYPSVLVLLLLGSIFLLKPIVQFFVENNIRLIGIEKHGVEPQDIDIDFQYSEACRHAHATLTKDDRTYHWSFEANDFIE